MLIDMHCHLDLYKKPHIVVDESKQKKFYILSVTTTPKAWSITNRLALPNKRIRTALGFYPQLISDRFQEIELVESLIPQTKYIGEIGLDGGDYKKSFHLQVEIFRRILNALKNHGGKIMSIHSRDSVSFVLDELRKTEGISILHWFSVGPSMINSKKGRAMIYLMPKDKVLTETDGPFAQHKGISNALGC
ncbi:MAG: TatD family hydrolase [Endomicrobium sp.]|jgi:TatD DNase family protein|nr:TatD family hydrolase [Endomicrobium sp.]